MLVPVTHSKVAPDGSASDREATISPARTSRSASLYTFLDGHRTSSSRAVYTSVFGLLYLCVGAKGRASGVLDSVPGDHDVCSRFGVAANGGGDLHPTGGLP
jgi:hypothetical protein